MILPRPQLLAALSVLLCFIAIAHAESHSQLRGPNVSKRRAEAATATAEISSTIDLDCRVTIKEEAREDGHGGIKDEDNVVCIQQMNDGDSSTILRLADIPAHVYKKHEQAIAAGKLYMSFAQVSIDGDSVVMSDATECTVMQNAARKLDEQDLEGPRVGDMTLAIVRVSTIDATLTATSGELRQTMLTKDGPSNVMSQYREMSFGQLTFTPTDIYEIFIPESVSIYDGVNMSHAVDRALVDQLGLEKASDLADRAFYCIPKGVVRGFIAFTYRNFWRS